MAVSVQGTSLKTVRARQARVMDLLRLQRYRYESAVFSRVDELRAMHAAAIKEVQAKLARSIQAGRGDTFTAFHLRIALEQLRDGVAQLERRFGAGLALGIDELAVEGRVQTRANLVRMEKVYKGTLPRIPLEEAATFMGVWPSVRTSLLAVSASSVARYGSVLIAAGEREIMLTLAQGGTTKQAADRVGTAMSVNWWQAERIARTEFAGAFNAVAAMAVRSDAAELPDLMGRWSELIDDLTGRPYDDRVANDSIALHGQIAPPGGVFTMPVSQNVSPKLWGKQWSFPPNRPNDRSCYGTWRPHWYDIPAWYMKAGTRLDVTPEMRRNALRKQLRSDVPPDVLDSLDS